MTQVFYDTKCCFCSGIINYFRVRANLKNIKMLDIEDFDQKKYSNLLGHDQNVHESIVFADEKSVYAYSDAVIRLLLCMGGIYRISGCLLKIIPKVIRDRLYKIVARNRYRLFGFNRCNLNS